MASIEGNRSSKTDLPVVIFIVTTPFAVNAFLKNHLATLSREFKVIVCTNLNAYELTPDFPSRVETYHVPFSRKISPWADLKAFLILTAWFYRFKPTVIHSITPKAGLLGMLAGFITRVPNRWHTFTGQVWATKNGFTRRVLKGFDQFIALLASTVFADSASQCRLLHAEKVVRENQITMLGTGSIAGVDTKRFYPSRPNCIRLRDQLGTDINACVFLFVGRLVKDKGVFDLIRAYKELSRIIDGIELWVVGPDEDGLLPTLKDSANGCDATIRWLDATQNPEKFMQAADILLLPSYREGFGSVIIEGAACGIPAVAYRIDGIIDAIIDGKTGLLVEVGQPTAFAAAMKTLTLNGEMRANLGDQARMRALRDYRSEKITALWLEYYSQHVPR
jgi:glycosyltransferase involved in cell wall biosynthesis